MKIKILGTRIGRVRNERVGFLYTPKTDHKCDVPFPGRVPDGSIWQCDDLKCKKIWRMVIVKTYGSWQEITHSEANDLYTQMGSSNMERPK